VKTSRRKWLTIGLAFVLVACAAPFLPLSFLRPRVENALSAKLGRRVDIGDVSFTLFTGPGFALSNIIVHEDPRAGIEPFVYAQTADARLDLLALLQGRRGFSSLRLVDATLNLVKTRAGDWNFQYLNAARLEDAPTLHFRNTRVNVKIGDTKSAFYFDGSDLDVSPGNQGSVALRFSGVPGRTDHPAQNFGQLFVRGSWAPAAQAQPLNLSIELEPSSFDGVSKLFGRTWFDLQGQLSFTAQLAGLPSRLTVAGEAQLDEGRRSDFLPNPDAKRKLPFRGMADLQAETLQLENVPDTKAASPISVRLTGTHLVSSPLWTASVDVQEQPLGGALEAARRVGVPFPDKLAASGTVAIALQYDSTAGLSGSVVARDASFSVPDTPAFRADSLPLKIAAQTISAGPVMLALEQEQNAQLEASYKFDGSAATDVKWTSRGVSLAALHPFAAAPLLDHVALDAPATGAKASDAKAADPKSQEQSAPDQKRAAAKAPESASGMWRGTVRYQGAGGEGVWTGDYSLENAQLVIDGIGDPVRLQSASVNALPGRFSITRMKGSAGDVPFTGEYRWDPRVNSANTSPVPNAVAKSAMPSSFKLQIPQASLAELQRLFRPALVRAGGILQRTIRLGGNAPAPDWMSQRKLEGSLSIASLVAGDATFAVDAPHVVWNGASLEIAPLSARALVGPAFPAALSGELAIDLSSASAQYRMKGKLIGLPYKAGRVDLDGLLEASGEGPALFASLRASGNLNGRGIAFADDATFRTASAQFEASVQGTALRWKLKNVEVTRGNEVYKGDGESQPDGKLVLNLTNLGKPVQFTGSASKN
jgi:hypothetical protein